VPLIGADSAQTLLDWLNRRRALQLGAVSLAVATVGVVALRWPQGTARIRVTGVGWSGPFDDPIIQKRLSADLQAAGRQASGYTFCHGSMVLLVRKRAIPALPRADLLVQVRGTSGTEARFDVDR
jgi:hypothetical protein